MLALAFALPADAATLYRYINDKGYQEIGYSVPTHLVPNGYDVIDESGRLVRRVAAQLSEEEYALKLERDRKLEACEKAVARVHRRYESLEDIDNAERHFEAQLEESLQNAHANLEYNQTELKKLLDMAAAFEREGRIISESHLDSVDRVRTTIDNLNAQIEKGERSKGAKAADFDEERRVFQLVGCDEEQLAHAGW
jgi:predicted ribosome quality control (RQC) complex YloA/Tae2 family protein